MADWLGGYWFDGDWFNPAFDEDPNVMSASLTGSASVSANLVGVYIPGEDEQRPPTGFNWKYRPLRKRKRRIRAVGRVESVSIVYGGVEATPKELDESEYVGLLLAAF